MNVKLIFLWAFCLYVATPSVFAQRKHAKCTQAITLDLGSHRIFVDGQFGGNVGLTIENTISQNLSWNMSFRDFINRSDVSKNYAPNENIIEHRIAILSGLNFYPTASLFGFFMSLNGGAMAHINAIPTSKPFAIKAGQSYKDALTTNFGLIYDFKMGYQFVNDYKFILSPFLGAGLYHPVNSNLKFLTTEPYFQLGLKIGKSL